MRHTYAKIKLDNLVHNFNQIRRIVGSKKIIAVVKANAYGHGIIEVSRALEECGVDYLAVAFASEGMELRKAGIRVPILVMVQENSKVSELIVQYDLDCVFETLKVAKEISKVASRMGKTARLHLYVDTGMHRDGATADFVFELYSNARKLPSIEIVGLMSHFSSSTSDYEFTLKQLNEFAKIVREFHENGVDFPLKHIANSGGILYFPESFFDAVRPGLLLYGYLPSGAKCDLEFRPVMELYSKVISVRKIRKGESVGYDRHFISPYNTQIATIPIGYGDGIPRSLSDNLNFIINGKLYRAVGGVCMDEIMVDVGCDDVRTDDDVVIIGSQNGIAINAYDLAKKANTIVYEILTGITHRVPRIFESNSKEK